MIVGTGLEALLEPPRSAGVLVAEVRPLLLQPFAESRAGRILAVGRIGQDRGAVLAVDLEGVVTLVEEKGVVSAHLAGSAGELGRVHADAALRRSLPVRIAG